MIDQMIGATADDIGATVQWNFWALTIGLLPQSISCLPPYTTATGQSASFMSNPYFSWLIGNLNNTDCLFDSTHGLTTTSEAATL